MSLFDMVKGKAAELLTGASDKVSELTGIDLPGSEIADQFTASADGLAGAGQDAVGTVTDAGQNSSTPRALPVTPPRARSARSPTQSIPARGAEDNLPPSRVRPPIGQSGRIRDPLARGVTRSRDNHRRDSRA